MVSRRPYVAAVTVVAAIVIIQIIRGKDQQTKGQNAAAVVALTVLVLAVAAVGEFSPGIATGFAALLLVAVLLGGTNAVQYLFHDLPSKLKGA